ncbi:MAG: DUF169 domain-containing protein [Clostridium sp.]|uniref:DUF169 domain-containing protein n=1 Tax=Clostridium sp. TaxID=1506 RepID=UPI003D6CE543
MNYNKIPEMVTKANCSLELKSKIIGVKFLYSEEEFNSSDEQTLNNKMTYCVLAKLAMHGHSIKANLDNFACLSSARALGFIESDEKWLSGCQYHDKGMYNDLITSKKVVDNTTNIKQKVYGVILKPLDEYSTSPDVVIMVTNPYNIMRLIQGYTYTYGTYNNFKLIGNQAFCSECTAYPFVSDNINISTLCAGTRHMAGWGKDEMALGIPYNKFVGMIEGLYSTINIMEPNEDKAIIEEKLKQAGRDDFTIEYDKNYYTGAYLK